MELLKILRGIEIYITRGIIDNLTTMDTMSCAYFNFHSFYSTKLIKNYVNLLKINF